MRYEANPLLITVGVLSFAAAIPCAAQPGGPPKSAQAETKTARLFVAIRDNDDTAVAAALKTGSDPNGRNWLGFTPLDWASVRGRNKHVEMLLSKGARIDDPSPYGTPLTFSIIGRHRDLAMVLLAKGASTQAKRDDGATPLMLAAANGFDEVVSALVKKESNLDAVDVEGDTALIYAARMGTTSVKTLISSGANVNIADHRGRTALMEAAANGHADTVKALISAKAKSDLRDSQGATALLLAARFNGGREVVDQLLLRGASARTRDHQGNTPLSLAISRGYNDTAARLRQADIGIPAPSTVGNGGSTRTAIDLSLNAIQTGMTSFANQAHCDSCHHQGLGLMALGAANDAGFKVNGKLIGDYLAAMGENGKASGPTVHNAVLHSELAGTVPAIDIGDMPIGAGYMMSGMLANHVPANPGMAEALQLVAGEQQKDGRWIFGIHREPMQGSEVTTTALVLRVLKEYGSKAPSAQTGERIKRAEAWLAGSRPTDTEGKAFRLLGMFWGGAEKEECAVAARDLLSVQRADGGWAQSPGSVSDAYATGIALCALQTAGGTRKESRSIRQGVQFLVRTQEPDGSWYVNKRTMPANNYFDAGFPHGESQYASFAATCWAVMALVENSRKAG